MIPSSSQAEVAITLLENSPLTRQTPLNMKCITRLLKINRDLGLLCLFLPSWEGHTGVRICTSVPLQPKKAENLEHQMSAVSCDPSEEDELGTVQRSNVDEVVNATCVHYIHTLCTRCRRYKALPVTLPTPVYERLIRKWGRRPHPATHSKGTGQCSSSERWEKTASGACHAGTEREYQNATGEIKRVNRS